MNWHPKPLKASKNSVPGNPKLPRGGLKMDFLMYCPKCGVEMSQSRLFVHLKEHSDDRPTD